MTKMVTGPELSKLVNVSDFSPNGVRQAHKPSDTCSVAKKLLSVWTNGQRTKNTDSKHKFLYHFSCNLWMLTFSQLEGPEVPTCNVCRDRMDTVISPAAIK
jgi:hypothetical protein